VPLGGHEPIGGARDDETFETFGAPWLNGWKLAKKLNDMGLPGAHFRPIQFQPTFNKHMGELCGGCFLHVNSRRAFEPVLSAIAILRTCYEQAKDKFKWKEPPYEYESEKRPIDILFGHPGLADIVLSDTHLNEIRQLLMQDAAAFEPQRRAAMLYPTS